ncbi:MAG: hypothetical protein E7163_00740 [Firmicutes bacterium]|nr:hypothetical protein [Bacillota bacterium]
MNYNNILILGTGQIGKAILNQILHKQPKKVIIHNLTEKESIEVCKSYSALYPEIKFISSYGNVFMPYKLKDINNKELFESCDEIIEYFYKETTNKTLEKSTIATLIKKYKPELIIDAINTATVLGNSYNPEDNLKRLSNNPIECATKLMVDDYSTKIINFVYSLKYGIETYDVKKYVKVSTTGLGGMGVNMPYTHGDNPKINLSSALMGKIAASGVLHQLLWNLQHTKGMNISLIIPGTFVGYDSVLDEPIETDKGLLYKRKSPKPYELVSGDKIKYNNNITSEYLHFPVVRAGENHVYSKMELEVLTSIGQMEGITKEEVANKVMECLYGNSSNDALVAMDNAMLKPTYLGREMIYDIYDKFNESEFINGIATGNLGVNLSKQLYELYLIKISYPYLLDLKNENIDKIVEKVNNSLNQELIEEIITLGIPILTCNNNFYIGDYSLVPNEKEDKTINEENIEYWTKIGWVDLRKENIEYWIKILFEIYEDANLKKNKDNIDIYYDYKKITNNYNIAEYLAYYNNLKNKGRKK